MTAPAIGFRKYNPGFLPDSEIVSRFVVRQTELDSLLGLVRGNDGPFNQHALVLGPRGFGKSHLVHRVAAECRRDEALRERWLPVVFAEESYQVASLGELWAEAVDRLSLATGDLRWEGIATELRKERDERRLAARALATLLELADTRKQRLLIIIENLDQLMDEGGLPSDDAWSLRKTLQNEPRVMLLATAVHRFEGIERPDQALFDLFYRVELAPLNARECSQLWLATTGEDLGVRRARSLAILAGGNPRLIVALASFARGRKLAELLVDFDELIDDWTDYFKGNIEAMPPQLRRVFLTLAELWRPSPARGVAEAARMPVNEASAALQRLTSQGRVTITRTQGKSHYYQVSERLYNIYYLMRRRGPGAARVRALLDFVRHMFGPCQSERPRETGEWRERSLVTIRSELQQALVDREVVSSSLEAVQSDTIRLAAAGLLRPTLDLLLSSPAADLIEPLIVALQRKLGETVDAPIEVSEVAEVIERRIDALRETGDIWRADPLTIPLADELP